MMQRHQRWILGVGIALVSLAVLATRRPGLDPAWVRFWDNAHWTLGYGFAAALAWSGALQASGPLRRARRYFAWGLSLYALGQACWDIQVLVGWNPFPGPSDLFFISLGACLALGLSSPGKELAGPSRWVFLLDHMGMALVALGLSLALFLPQRVDQSWAVILALASYPTLLSTAFFAGLATALANRWRLERGLLLLLLAILAKDLLWLEWNRRTLAKSLADGVLLNYLFSYTALGLGYFAARFEAPALVSAKSERPYFLIANLLPVLLALFAGLVFAVGLSSPAPALLGALAALALITVMLRQSLLVLEHDRLRSSERRYHEMMLERVEAQRLHELGGLAGGVAHDFNNILAVVSLEADLLRQKSGTTEELDRISKAAERGRDLVQRISYYARPDRGLKIQALDLGSAVEEALRLLRPLVPAQVQILVEPPAAPLAVSADPVQLQQVLVNLGINAAQALGKQGGWVRYGWKALRAEGSEAPRVELSVRDNGPGMAPEVLARIFEPFFTTKDPGQGSGLGLAIVDSIVAQAGGSVHCESRPGEGATFFVSLQQALLEPDSAGPAVAPPGPAPAPAKARQALVVDDEADLAQALARFLEHWGWKAAVATHPTQAIALFQAEPGRFNLVITDKTMPGMDGYELLAMIKRLDPSVKTLLVSGFDEAGGAPQVDGFLGKPFSQKALRDAVERLV